MSRLIRWNPVRQPSAFEYALDRLFADESWRSFFNTGTTQANPLALDLTEVDNAFHLKTDLPGIEAEHIDVRVEDDLLTISAEIPETVTENKDDRVLMRERRYGKMSRTVRLPQAVNADQIEATFNNGVLELILPKQPNVQPKQISVKVGNGNGNAKK
jgi:HSP20 family protein